MEDKAFLQQQIEFLEFQLEDAKTREIQMKKMYESMLSSLTAEPIEKDNDKKINQMQIENNKQLQSMEAYYKEKINNLENIVNILEGENQELKEENNTVKNSYEQKILFLKEDIENKTILLSDLNKKFALIQEDLKIKEKKIIDIKIELEALNNKYHEDLFKAHSEENQKLQELKAIYENEKNSLKQQIAKAHTEEKIASPSQCFAEMICDTDLNLEQLAGTHKYIEKLLNDCRSAIHLIPKDLNDHSLIIADLPLRERLDVTERMLKFSEKVQDHFSSIKKSLNSLKKLIDTTEETEKKFKDLIHKKNEEIENLQRVMSIKTSDQIKNKNTKLIEDLITKDSEICKLKKIIGELREGETTNKPPMHTRSKTLTNLNSPLKIQAKANIAHLNLTALHSNDSCDRLDEGNYYTTASSDRVSEEKIEMYEQKIATLKIALLKLKNQRDRAKNISEKLLTELKQRKLDFALSQESFAEEKFSIMNQLKSLLNYILPLTTSTLMPKILKQDLQKVLNYYSQYI